MVKKNIPKTYPICVSTQRSATKCQVVTRTQRLAIIYLIAFCSFFCMHQMVPTSCHYSNNWIPKKYRFKCNQRCRTKSRRIVLCQFVGHDLGFEHVERCFVDVIQLFARWNNFVSIFFSWHLFFRVTSGWHEALLYWPGSRGAESSEEIQGNILLGKRPPSA